MNAELKSGSTLGHYELLTRIGRGGMASVWVAREKAPVSGKQRLVAVKAMLPELARHSDFRAMFLGEGQIVRSIDHPNVVKVHEVSEDRGILYMAMEWVEGDSLRTLIKEAKRRRAIPAEMAVKIIADTAAGLHAAHELRGWDGELRNIVHCDVSPHNILVGLDGQAKLVDFGVANATAHTELEGNERIKGKFGYMSPEQASLGKIDRRSDVFALGIVLYELTTGERLFRGDDAAHTLELVRSGRIPPPQEVYAKYPEGLSAIVLRALARDVDERFQTAADFRDALEQYLKDERIMVSPAGVGQLVKRVLGARIEQQRNALREALIVADGTVVTGLVPEHSALPDRFASERLSGHFALHSEPPTSGSQYSNSRTGTTPHPQTLDRRHGRKSGLLPLFAALAGLAAAGSAIYWASHRGGPMPLITTRIEHPQPRAASTSARADEDTGPVGVNIDSLPTAAAAIPPAPEGNTVSGGPAGHRPAAPAVPLPPVPAKPTKDVGREPDEVENPYKVSEPSPAEAPPATTAPSATPPAAIVPPDQRSPLNRGAALAALGSAASAAAACKRDGGPSGSGSASVTFSPDGPVKSVTVSAPFASTAVGQCVANVFRGVRVPAFSGSSITLPKSFQIPR
ncbi:MAG TPA: serine/threonine-protein kinase [Polyangiaceae bacterium]|nr:serine/threonine-protein kinase [Polyangiaceae bacterium]